MNTDKTIYCFKLEKLISKLHDNTLKSKFQIKKGCVRLGTDA